MYVRPAAAAAASATGAAGTCTRLDFDDVLASSVDPVVDGRCLDLRRRGVLRIGVSDSACTVYMYVPRSQKVKEIRDTSSSDACASKQGKGVRIRSTRKKRSCSTSARPGGSHLEIHQPPRSYNQHQPAGRSIERRKIFGTDSNGRCCSSIYCERQRSVHVSKGVRKFIRTPPSKIMTAVAPPRPKEGNAEAPNPAHTYFFLFGAGSMICCTGGRHRGERALRNDRNSNLFLVGEALQPAP